MTSAQKRQLREALNDEDVEGLLALRAPADEYSEEAERIAAALQESTMGAPSERGILGILQSVWADSFGPLSEAEMSMKTPGLTRIARRILGNFAGADRLAGQ